MSAPEISDVRISIPDMRKMRSPGLLCFADLTIFGPPPNGMRIHGIKLVQKSNRAIAIKFPTRWREVACERCGGYTLAGSEFCIRCGARDWATGLARYEKDSGRYDIIHPMSNEWRYAIQRAVMNAYEEKLKELQDGNNADLPRDPPLSDGGDDGNYRGPLPA